MIRSFIIHIRSPPSILVEAAVSKETAKSAVDDIPSAQDLATKADIAIITLQLLYDRSGQPIRVERLERLASRQAGGLRALRPVRAARGGGFASKPL